VSAEIKFTVDYDMTDDPADIGWTGVLYPTKADADWAAENLKAMRPDLKNIHVETLDLSAPRML
jgi:hypothetical protein